MDTPLRTTLKSVIWTFIGFAVMAFVGFAFTGSLAIGGGMALANATVGLASYVVYERVWARIRWGRH